MPDLSSRNFGLLIAYVIPGFVALWGVSLHSPIVRSWLDTAPAIPGGIESVIFVLLASTAAGLIASALRWLVIDNLNHRTGIPRPAWDDGRLQSNLQAFDAVVEAHYRFYQAHTNLAVVLLFSLAAWHATRPTFWELLLLPDTGVIGLAVLLYLTGRDNLRKYYARTARILGSLSPGNERRFPMSNGHGPKQPPKPKPAPQTKPPKGSK